MLRRMPVVLAALGAAAVVLLCSNAAMADGNLKKVNHIIIVMQENHSFDNYFGVLALLREVLITTGTVYAPLRTTSASMD